MPDKNWLIELTKPISDEAGYLHKFDFWFWCFKRIIFFKENREIKNETNKK
ncbi:unnamed protein product [marine sediment metagenome]|uniref:Uncharacterized protein n=1 Tax=marine sediment metagenome TaxID=412755 RepID=X0V813_9ZZZZ